MSTVCRICGGELVVDKDAQIVLCDACGEEDPFESETLVEQENDY